MMRIAIALQELGHQWKVVMAMLFTVMATAADAVMPATADGWGKVEDLTVKGLLALLAFTFWRNWMAEVKVNQDLRDKHDAKMESVVAENTRSNQAVVTTLERQVKFYDTLTQQVVQERITSHGHAVGRNGS